MKILINQDANGRGAWLTNESATSLYGIPVLEIRAGELSGVFGPADRFNVASLTGQHAPQIITAAQVVAAWARLPRRTREEREFAAQFLRQWPDGPQVECGPTREEVRTR